MLDKFLYQLVKSSLLGMTIMMACIIANSLGFYFLWTWFVAPTFGMISLPQATGMILLLSVLGFFPSAAYKSLDQKERNKQDWSKLFAEVAKVGLYLMLGFGLNYFFN